MKSPSPVLLPLLVVPSTALAYLNPESGTMLIQALLGGLAGAAVLFRLYWMRIRAYFKPTAKAAVPETPRDA